MRPAVRTPRPPLLRLAGFVLLSLAAAGASGPGPAEPRRDRTPLVCEAAVQHPIQVRIEPLDPVRRGATVRLRVTSSSRVGLATAEARVVSTGGATPVGRMRAPLGRMRPGVEVGTEFAVSLPAQGDRHLIQLRVEGEGPAGRIGRGATFNLLPDGPTSPDRIVAGTAGTLVAEHRARRLP